jgi:two-component system cell cycle response regulator DivK
MLVTRNSSKGRGGPAAPISTGRGDAPGADRKPFVLVVDDMPDARRICVEYLEYRHFRVETAEDGLDALAKARELRPDLILMDLSMPRLDGCEATRRLKSDARTAAIPIIAVTAHGSGGTPERALDAGCLAVVMKPVRLKHLEGEIQRLLAEGGREPVA